MICSNCGYEHSEDYCPACGKSKITTVIDFEAIEKEEKALAKNKKIAIISIVIACVFIGGFSFKAIADKVIAGEAAETVKITVNEKRILMSLSVGQYVVGEDIDPGKYDVLATSGQGNFMGSVRSCQLGSLNEVLAAAGNEYFQNSSYSNLRLAEGDSFEIKGDLVLRFTSK